MTDVRINLKDIPSLEGKTVIVSGQSTSASRGQSDALYIMFL